MTKQRIIENTFEHKLHRAIDRLNNDKTEIKKRNRRKNRCVSLAIGQNFEVQQAKHISTIVKPKFPNGKNQKVGPQTPPLLPPDQKKNRRMSLKIPLDINQTIRFVRL